MDANLLARLLVDELRSLYSAENQLVKVLPKMGIAASAPELQAGLQGHLAQTWEHIARLESIFETMREKPKGRICKNMAGLIRTVNQLIHDNPESEVLDAGLIANARRLEHYEMAGYGCVCVYARLLDDNEAAALLSLTLEEEKETDDNLARLSERINVDVTVRI